jgi:tRNA U34 2-thiouridine synthase MnmA/TrmU
MTKALVVFSGGLDSILAVKVLEEQGIEVTGLSFDSYFFDTEESKKTAEQLGINLITKDISEKQLDTVKNPQYGHGSALNPCIDCHGLMFRVAGELAELVGKGKKFDFIATGEVLGQRPFSQNSEALKKVEKLAGVDILRPLSAKLLPKTSYEEEGLVDRNKLLDISGKSRRRQLELVEKYGVEYFPSPAGGCRLTENEFGVKVKQLLENDGKNRELGKVDFELLRIGRHHWLHQDTGYKIQDTNKFQSLNPKQPFDDQEVKVSEARLTECSDSETISLASDERIGEQINNINQNKAHIILGKNHEENQQLKKSAKEGDILIELEDVMGPIALVLRNNKIKLEENKELISKVKKMMLDRTKSKDSDINEIKWLIIKK